MTAPGLSPIERAIKLADRDLIDASGKTLAVAAHFDVSASLVGRWNNLNDDLFISAARRVELEDATRDVPGHPHFTRAMAKRQGFTLVKLPDGSVPSGGDLHKAIAAHSRCANDVTSELIADLADGVIDPGEAARGIAKCDAAIEQVIALRTFLQQIVETV